MLDRLQTIAQLPSSLPHQCHFNLGPALVAVPALFGNRSAVVAVKLYQSLAIRTLDFNDAADFGGLLISALVLPQLRLSDFITCVALGDDGRKMLKVFQTDYLKVEWNIGNSGLFDTIFNH